MTIDEAIEILERHLVEPQHPQLPDNSDAIKLGVEALKAYKKSQEARWYHSGYKLPGETKD